MQCPTCSHENRDTAKFCNACGAALALGCAQCGADLRANAKFCEACGVAVRGSGAGDQGNGPPQFQPHVQYVTTPDGVRIAYAAFGSGGGVPLVGSVSVGSRNGELPGVRT